MRAWDCPSTSRPDGSGAPSRTRPDLELKRESREAARADVFRFIEVEYNRTRLRKHPEFGYLTPLETRARLKQGSRPQRKHPLSKIRVNFTGSKTAGRARPAWTWHLLDLPAFQEGEGSPGERAITRRLDTIERVLFALAPHPLLGCGHSRPLSWSADQIPVIRLYVEVPETPRVALVITADWPLAFVLPRDAADIRMVLCRGRSPEERGFPLRLDWAGWLN
ncbi:hypothetical protein ACFY2M_40275 [Streptomyces sp. NPDC001276]|uniref:hypothetical protein n=1 Tax=Streptomyces sp. NPDC001276 TaxID=3364555 RepID=UPI00369871F8